MKRKSELYIEDIQEAISRIEEYTQGNTFESFQRDKKTIDAVLRNLEIIGEAASNLPYDLKSKFDIPWREIKDFRNIVVHKYWSVDLDIVWEIIQERLPSLHQKLQPS